LLPEKMLSQMAESSEQRNARFVSFSAAQQT
jgi:hypothetical protein